MTTQTRTVVFEEVRSLPVHKRDAEIVERKGVGHPDFIIDSICEASSVKLSKYYMERFNRILHHNLDKGLLVGGRAAPRFGGGELLEPILIVVAGRATTRINNADSNEEIPVGEMILEAGRNFIRENFRFLDPDRHVIFDYKVKPGSVDLVAVVESPDVVPLANDTSFGVGFAPFTPLEKLVLMVERTINSKEFKSRIKESGEDCKVMGLRLGSKVNLTVADGIVSHLTYDLDHYVNVKEEIADAIADLAAKFVSEYEVTVNVNAADRIFPGQPERSTVYLTVTGTSAEQGDDGNAGRGNRASGLITPFRYMSMEATAGKNPVSHVGKIYNVLAFKTAARIYESTDAFEEVYVKLLSQIGRRIDQPLSVTVNYIPARAVRSGDVYEVNSIVNEELDNITKVTADILDGKVTLF
ncbi:MAG: methionine adenosyltransferase [Thaumarchaeota archaeon]|nr:methionine adenosyltransferase [Candidatus Calditenuaceae archaeon]